MQEVLNSNCELESIMRSAKKFAYSYGQIGLVELDDIVQSTMIKVLRKQDGRQVTVSWLYKAVRSTALDAVRAAAADRRLLAGEPYDELGVVCEGDGSFSQMRVAACNAAREDDVEIDLMPRLKSMLGKLSKPMRQVLVLHCEGFSYQEIAQLTDTNLGTVRSRLHYARRRAKEFLGDLD
jgi:RNA polymerase sigma-70 factor (ECF subfamily)